MTDSETAEQRQKIAANVRLALDELGPISGIEFGLDDASVAWVDGFVERQRARPDFDLDQAGGLVAVIGSFVGECVVASTGGQWRLHPESGWGVLLPIGAWVFPFTKAHKAFRGGHDAGESILSFYQITVGYIATGKIGGEAR